MAYQLEKDRGKHRRQLEPKKKGITKNAEFELRNNRRPNEPRTKEGEGLRGWILLCLTGS